ncbi:MAG: hypothetical protein AB7V46_05035 [Thermomicrobiales bacterium]
MARTIQAYIENVDELPLPEEVRRTLRIVKGSSVTYVLDESGVRILPATSSIAHVFGSVEPLPDSSEDFDIEIEDALQARADELMRRS